VEQEGLEPSKGKEITIPFISTRLIKNGLDVENREAEERERERER
jgi:hypothetical protein